MHPPVSSEEPRSFPSGEGWSPPVYGGIFPAWFRGASPSLSGPPLFRQLTVESLLPPQLSPTPAGPSFSTQDRGSGARCWCMNSFPRISSQSSLLPCASISTPTSRTGRQNGGLERGVHGHTTSKQRMGRESQMGRGELLHHLTAPPPVFPREHKYTEEWGGGCPRAGSKSHLISEPCWLLSQSFPIVWIPQTSLRPKVRTDGNQALST